jgi:PiT family inorganic phosphate transporter
VSPGLAILFLSSGLFLGWNLGANDAGNVLGSAVGSGMLSFRRAAGIGAVFVVAGAVAGGSGGAETLGELGNIASQSGAFMVALSASLCLLLFTRLRLPVSTSQAVVGSIIGWNLFQGSPVNWGKLATIALSWISSPLLSGLFAILLYFAFMFVLRRMRIHLFYRDVFLRVALSAAGAFGAYSLGANNIGNVMGVFVQSAPFAPPVIGGIQFSTAQLLFFLGGLAIAIGILTYSKHVMLTVGADIYHLSPETALVAVVAVSTVLMLFSSSWLPRVPVSSSQAAVGAVIGIALAKGGRNINLAIVGKIAAGWILTPLLAAAVSFVMLNLASILFGGIQP